MTRRKRKKTPKKGSSPPATHNPCPICNGLPQVERFGGWFRSYCKTHKPHLQTPFMASRVRSILAWNKHLFTSITCCEATHPRTARLLRNNGCKLPPIPEQAPLPPVI